MHAAARYYGTAGLGLSAHAVSCDWDTFREVFLQFNGLPSSLPLQLYLVLQTSNTRKQVVDIKVHLQEITEISHNYCINRCVISSFQFPMK